MKKIWCLLLAFSLAFSMTACSQDTSQQQPPPAAQTPAEETKDSPKKYSSAQTQAELLWTTGIDLVQPLSGTVEGSTETYVRELTDPKYQGRSGGSEGNRAAADYIAAEFERLGLQQLPGLGGWKQSYPTSITAVLPGEAWLVDPDGSEAPLELGVDWAFRASPEPVDATLTLSTDDALCDEGKGIWDAKLDLKGTSRRLSLTSGDVANGTNYTNATGTPSRILVSEEVYAQLNQPGYQIRLRLPDAVDELGTAENAVAYLPGRDSTKAVLLGANFDGAGQCGALLMAGAYNNASGVATMLQTAAWLAGADELPCDVIFAAFNTEDNRENGSTALANELEGRYEQLRMLNLKCLGWQGHPLTVYGTSANANLRNSLAGGLGLQYADRDLGADEKAFYGEKMSAVVLFQDACLSDPEANAVLNSTRDTAENLDFSLLDTTAQQLAAWVIERGDEPLNSHVVYW